MPNRGVHLLEEVGVVDVAEERNGVGQHPDIPAAAVVIGLRPPAVFVSHRQDLVLHPLGVCRFVQRVRVETWDRKATQTSVNFPEKIQQFGPSFFLMHYYCRRKDRPRIFGRSFFKKKFLFPPFILGLPWYCYGAIYQR